MRMGTILHIVFGLRGAAAEADTAIAAANTREEAANKLIAEHSPDRQLDETMSRIVEAMND